jgi:hypothetical protein
MEIHRSHPVGKLEFMLYRSPDAFYDVESVRTRSGMIGVGRSSGFGFGPRNDAPDWQSEYFVANRVGDPRWDLCPSFSGMF